MATPEKVQEYLQRHRVGLLFEDLMAKVINDMPEDPTVYLARILQLRVEHKEGRPKSPLKKSGELDKKTYDRPWQTNSKRLQPKDMYTKTGPGKKSLGSRPDWDKKTKLPPGASSLDDLWDDPKALSRSRDIRSSSPPGKYAGGGMAAWADSNGDGEDVMFSTYGYRGPHKVRRETDDPLAGELGLMKTKSQTSSVRSVGVSSKRGGRNAGSARHKADLQKYISSSQQKMHDSGIEDDKDTVEDDAIELLEDDEDLRREGVKNAKKSGVRMSRSMMRSGPAQANVRVGICARCANVMGEGSPSQPAPGAGFAAVTGYDYDTEKELETNRQQSGARFSTPASDDEFESVSQVNGPRRPVWQDSDNDAVTPRKGHNMLASNMSPNKGLPMYRGKYAQPGSKKTAPTRSEDYSRGDGGRGDPLRSTWSPAADGEYSEKQALTSRTETIADGDKKKDDDVGAGSTAGWQVPPDYDTDSSFYGSPGARTQRLDQAY